MAQRMESVAPPGGVMISDSPRGWSRASAVLGYPQLVRIKGAEDARAGAHGCCSVAANWTPDALGFDFGRPRLGN